MVMLPPLSPFFCHFLRFRVRDDVFSFLAAGGKPTPEHGMFFCRLAEIKSEVGINYIYISIYIYIFIHSFFPILSSFRSDFSPPFFWWVLGKLRIIPASFVHSAFTHLFIIEVMYGNK